MKCTCQTHHKWLLISPRSTRLLHKNLQGGSCNHDHTETSGLSLHSLHSSWLISKQSKRRRHIGWEKLEILKQLPRCPVFPNPLSQPHLEDFLVTTRSTERSLVDTLAGRWKQTAWWRGTYQAIVHCPGALKIHCHRNGNKTTSTYICKILCEIKKMRAMISAKNGNRNIEYTLGIWMCAFLEIHGSINSEDLKPQVQKRLTTQ